MEASIGLALYRLSNRTFGCSAYQHLNWTDTGIFYQSRNKLDDQHSPKAVSIKMPPKMPPTRRKPSNPTSTRAAQPTLTFHSRSNKVTKPHLTPVPVESKLLKVKPEEVLKAAELSTPSPAPDDVDSGAEHGSTTAELAIKEQVKIEHAAPKSAADERAEKITDAQIKRYWKAKEDERKAPRGMSSTMSIATTRNRGAR